MALKEKVERFVMLSFSVGCASQSSVAVVENQPKKVQNKPNFMAEDEDGGKDNRIKSSSLLLHLLRPNYSSGLQKLVKGFKMLSNLFTIYRKDDEEEEAKMEIGYPTDVQHVAHIGWDGFNNLGGMKSWEKAPEFFPLSSFSLKQFEQLAMASQAECSGPL